MTAALLLAAAVSAAAAEPLTSPSPFRSSDPVTPPGVTTTTPRFGEPRRDPVPPPVSEQVRREGFERRERQGGTTFGDVLLEHRRRGR